MNHKHLPILGTILPTLSMLLICACNGGSPTSPTTPDGFDVPSVPGSVYAIKISQTEASRNILVEFVTSTAAVVRVYTTIDGDIYKREFPGGSNWRDVRLQVPCAGIPNTVAAELLSTIGAVLDRDKTTVAICQQSGGCGGGNPNPPTPSPTPDPDDGGTPAPTPDPTPDPAPTPDPTPSPQGSLTLSYSPLYSSTDWKEHEVRLQATGQSNCISNLTINYDTETWNETYNNGDAVEGFSWNVIRKCTMPGHTAFGTLVVICASGSKQYGSSVVVPSCQQIEEGR